MILLNHISWKKGNLIFTIPVFLILIQAYKTISAKLKSGQSTSSQVIFNKKSEKNSFQKLMHEDHFWYTNVKSQITYWYNLKMLYFLSMTHWQYESFGVTLTIPYQENSKEREGISICFCIYSWISKKDSM